MLYVSIYLESKAYSDKLKFNLCAYNAKVNRCFAASVFEYKIWSNM